DWYLEAVRMAEVYSHSYLNICATASKNSEGGLFRCRDFTSICACRVDTTWLAFPSGLFVCYNPETLLMNVGLSPLANRAWVLQERILSPRNVHFSERHVIWECFQIRASEYFVDGLPDDTLSVKSNLLVPGSGAKYGRQSMGLYWNNII